MDTDLEAGPVHVHHLLLDLILLHGQDTVVAGGALIRLGQVGGASGDGAVGHHLDPADAKHVVAQSRFDPGVPKGRKLGIPHQSVDPEAQLSISLPVLIGLKFFDRHPGVVDAGQSNTVQHVTDGPQTLPAHLGGVHGYHTEADVVNGPLVDHAIQPARVRIPAQPSARRVGSLVIEPGCF